MLTASELSWLLVLAFLLLLLMMGHFAKWAPWTLLRDAAVHVDARVGALRLLLMMPVALWIALATERAPQMIARWFPFWAKRREGRPRQVRAPRRG